METSASPADPLVLVEENTASSWEDSTASDISGDSLKAPWGNQMSAKGVMVEQTGRRHHDGYSYEEDRRGFS